MSFDNFDDLPSNFKEIIKQLMKQIENIDPEELSNFLSNTFKGTNIDSIMDYIKNNPDFVVPFNLSDLSKLPDIFSKIINSNVSDLNDEKVKIVETPYYEISPIIDSKGEIIVEVPGIDDVRQINWTHKDEIIEFIADAESIMYKLNIKVPNGIKLNDAFAIVKNSIFILPFTKME